MNEKDISPLPTDPSVRIAQELAEVAVQIQRSHLVDLTTQVNAGGISIPQYTILSFLIGEGGLTMSKLAELMEHTSPATTGLVDRLVLAGLVERFGNDRDRRQVLVKITALGIELAERIKRKIIYRYLQIAENVAHSDMEAWLRIYHVMIKKDIWKNDTPY